MELKRVLENIRDNRLTHFCFSQNIETHPLTKRNRQQRENYYTALDYFAKKFTNDAPFTNARLKQYRVLLLKNENEIAVAGKKRDKIIKSVIKEGLFWWRKNKRYLLFCDTAFLLMDKNAIIKMCAEMRTFLSQKQAKFLEGLCDVLFNSEPVPHAFLYVEDLIAQFRANIQFSVLPEKCFLVTANTSAGKSTLINAIVGKPVAKTAMEICTANLCHFFNKPFEDNAIHLLSSNLNLNASYAELTDSTKPETAYVSTYFNTLFPVSRRIRIIDTPGVNSALNPEHGEITRKALANEKYDKLIYVLNASKIGTDEEINYLRYVSQNVPQEKVIFILNKLDTFKHTEDSISGSMAGVKADLQNMGFTDPVICPLSAYFSLLLKMKLNNEELNDDDQDIFDLYMKKFGKAEYNLSAYYNQADENKVKNSGELQRMCLISGLYGLEKILHGDPV